MPPITIILNKVTLIKMTEQNDVNQDKTLLNIK
jgi:hypothetical protein